MCFVSCVCMSLLKWVHTISLSYHFFTERRRAQGAPDPVSVAAAR